MITLKSVKQKIRRRIKRKVDRKLGRGLERQWIRCQECDWIGYYDYVPYGLCGSILVMGCTCGSFDDVAEKIEFSGK